MVNLPSVPEIPSLDHILDLWEYSDDAEEVTLFFQQLFSRLPPYFLAFFALMLFFLVVPLIIRLVAEFL